MSLVISNKWIRTEDDVEDIVVNTISTQDVINLLNTQNLFYIKNNKLGKTSIIYTTPQQERFKSWARYEQLTTISLCENKFFDDIENMPILQINLNENYNNLVDPNVSYTCSQFTNKFTATVTGMFYYDILKVLDTSWNDTTQQTMYYIMDLLLGHLYIDKEKTQKWNQNFFIKNNVSYDDFKQWINIRNSIFGRDPYVAPIETYDFSDLEFGILIPNVQCIVKKKDKIQLNIPNDYTSTLSCRISSILNELSLADAPVMVKILEKLKKINPTRYKSILKNIEEIKIMNVLEPQIFTFWIYQYGLKIQLDNFIDSNFVARKYSNINLHEIMASISADNIIYLDDVTAFYFNSDPLKPHKDKLKISVRASESRYSHSEVLIQFGRCRQTFVKSHQVLEKLKDSELLTEEKYNELKCEAILIGDTK